MASFDPGELDQLIAQVRDLFPPAWAAIYRGCLAEGFTEQQAMELLKTYILSQGSGRNE